MANIPHLHTPAHLPDPINSSSLTSSSLSFSTSNKNYITAIIPSGHTLHTTAVAAKLTTKPTTITTTAPTHSNATRPAPILTSKYLPLSNNYRGGPGSPQQGHRSHMMASFSSLDLYEEQNKDSKENYDNKSISNHYRTLYHHNHPPNSSLPSPPLSSMTPTTPYSHHRSNFSSKTFSSSSMSSPSTIHSDQDRFEVLESELSALRIQIQQHEQTSTVREKRLSQFQQQSNNTQVSLQTLKHQHELVLAQLSKTQAESIQLKNQLEATSAENRQLKSQIQEQKRELREVTLDRDSLSLEMVECHSDNAKYLRRLRGSTDMLGSLQDENRSLIEQLREVRARVVELTEDKSKLSETLERERQRTSQAALGLEAVVTRYKGEVERLQDLVLAMGHKHVQTQAQLVFLQQIQQQKQQEAIQKQTELSSSSSSTSLTIRSPMVGSSIVPQSQQIQQPSSHGSLVLGDGALASILASVAASSDSRRSKPSRRFTVNGTAQQLQHQQEAPLTLEQRKCKFLMDQITVLQRGYDSIRQEKITLELQLDQIQRQYEFQQQQRQRRRSSQRRTLGSEQRALFSAAVQPPPPIPVIPPQHRQYLQQHQHHQKQLSLSPSIQLPNAPPPQILTEEEKNPPTKIRASMTKEERAEAERVQQQIQGALAALESKRKHNNEVSLSHLEELKHLESLKFPQEEEVKPIIPAKPQQQQHPRPQRGLPLHDPVDWGVQQCSCCIGTLIEI